MKSRYAFAPNAGIKVIFPAVKIFVNEYRRKDNRRIVLRLVRGLALTVLIIATGFANIAQGQTTLASEGFETGGSTLFTVNDPEGAVNYANEYANNGSYGLGYSYKNTFISGVATLTSSAISTTGYTDLQLSFRVRSATSNGLDADDYIKVYVSPDNGTTYYLRLWLCGDGHETWTYSTGTATATATYSTDNVTAYTHQISSLNLYGTLQITDLPAADQLRIEIEIADKYANSIEYWAMDDFSITGTPVTSVTTGTIAGSPFCISASAGASVSVPFTSLGIYSSNTYTAQLSDASGSFASPVTIGTLVSDANSGTISATIPAGTGSGTGYLIRVISSNPEITGSSSDALEIINGAVDVTSAAAEQDNAMAILTWTNPPACYDEIMIVAQAGSAVSSAPSGDGSAYTADLAFGSGTAYDGGYVVYKGFTSSQTVTGLTNGTTYYFTLFTRNGTSWSTGTTVTVTPAEPAAGEYRSVQSGNWATGSTWKYYTGSAWATPSSGPVSSDDVIIIRSGHTVTVAADVAVDQVTVASGGTVAVASGITLTVANGSDDVDFAVNGTLQNDGTVTTTGVLAFNDGGLYIHATSGTTLPTATWNTGSTCEITGWTSTTYLTSSFNQAFYNFTWNCPNQSTDVSLSGYVTPVAGTFTMSASGDYTVRPSTAAEYANYVQTGGTYSILGGTTSRSVAVTNDFTMIDGTFNLSRSAAVGYLSVAGDFTVSGGTLTETSTGSGSLEFNGTSEQIYTFTGTISNTIDITVDAGACLQMADESTVVGGEGTFTLSGGATLGITSANGITSSGSTGNIQSAGTRTFDTGANYIYNGSAAQETGSGLPSTVSNLTISNTGGAVTFSSTCAITNRLSVATGSVADLGSLTTYTAGTLTLSGVAQTGCTYGSSASSAIIQNNTYFASSASGYITVGTGTECAVAGMWLGGTSGALTDWNTASNWYGNTIPTSSTNVIISSAAINQPVIAASATADCNNLTIDDNALLTIYSTGVSSNGSLIVHGTGTGNITYERYMPASLYRYISGPVSSVTLPSGTTFWRWNESIGAWGEDVSETPTTSCSSGVGYTMLASGQTVSFTGAIVTSASQTGTAPYYSSGTYGNDRGTWGGGGWNLLGNPFTSAMSATTFISVNGASGNNSLDPNFNAVYIYNGSGYTYIGSEVDGFPFASNTFGYNDIQVGQGFFVLANYNGVTFSFTSAMQTHDVSVPMTKSTKSDNAWPGVMLKVKYGSGENSTLIVYNDNMTAGLDPGYDVGLLGSGHDVEIYTVLASDDNDVNFTRQALPVSGADQITVPIGIDYKNGGEVTFSAYTNALGDYRFWLVDRVTETFTDLGSDSYTVTLPAETYGTGRFYLKVGTTITDTETPADDTGIRIWVSDNMLIIKGEVSNKAECEVYDLSGQNIIRSHLTDSELNTLTLPSGLHGILLVRVVDGVKTYTKKVAVL